MGALTGKYSGAARPRGIRRMLPIFNQKSMDAVRPVIESLREIGTRYSKTPTQVALRWLIENPLVLPIPGAKNGRQAAENAGALSFSLTRGEIDALDRATARWIK
jgi:aryl-alcohol dehydrogenase-like predicted oxidoreductase